MVKDPGVALVSSGGPVWGGARAVGSDTTSIAAASHASAAARQREDAARLAMEEAQQAQLDAARRVEEAMAKAAAAKKRAEQVSAAAAIEEESAQRSLAEESCESGPRSWSYDERAASQAGSCESSHCRVETTFASSSVSDVQSEGIPSAAPASAPPLPTASLAERVERIKVELEMPITLPLAR